MAEKVVIGNAELWHGDCREVLPLLPRVDLMLTDPPYGIGIDGQKESVNRNPKHNRKAHDFMGWDNETPDRLVFELLRYKSAGQIVWGGNYFTDKLPHPTKGWLFWDKGQRGLTMSVDQLRLPDARLHLEPRGAARGRRHRAPDTEAAAPDDMVPGPGARRAHGLRPVHGQRDKRRGLRADGPAVLRHRARAQVFRHCLRAHQPRPSPGRATAARRNQTACAGGAVVKPNVIWKAPSAG